MLTLCFEKEHLMRNISLANNPWIELETGILQHCWSRTNIQD